MAVKFQYNKTSLTNLGKQLKIRQNALPTLKNKESALQNKWQEAIGIAGGRYKDGTWRELRVNN